MELERDDQLWESLEAWRNHWLPLWTGMVGNGGCGGAGGQKGPTVDGALR